MKKEELIRKLTSRKFIISTISAIAGIIALIVGDNATVQTIAGALMIIVPAVVYCVMEGKVDAASVTTISAAVTAAADKLGADGKTVEKLAAVGSAAASIAQVTQEETAN